MKLSAQKHKSAGLIITLLSFIHSDAQFRGGVNDGVYLVFSNSITIMDIISQRGSDGSGVSMAALTTLSISDLIAHKGGLADGSTLSLSPKQGITSNESFKGGDNDGSAGMSLSKKSIADSSVQRGGADDGLGKAILPAVEIIDIMAFKGGQGDGFSFIKINYTSVSDQTVFKGGSSDGVGYFIIPKTNIVAYLAFKGGIGRGETQSIPMSCGPYSMWNGNVSTAWENPANWDCGIVPGVNSRVIIPPGRARYPVVSQSTEIQSLMLQTGSSIHVQPNVLFKINSL